MTKFYFLVKRLLPVLILASCCTMALAQGRTVSGKVTSSDDGSAVPGVNILEKGTSNGTVSDADGNYRISVGDNATLVFSFVGYASQEVAVGAQSVINVTLASDVQALQEVVVIGYGQAEAKDITGAIVSARPENFNQGVIASPEQLIQGRLAGVSVTSTNGEPGAAVNIRIRGTSSMRAGNNPLFVVDGVPLSSDDTMAGGNAQGIGTSSAKNPLNFLNPQDIASIDVLKDASATAIYGSRGANGVVIITTKSGKSGKPTLEYSYNISASTITKKYDVLNAADFLSAYTKFNGAAAAASINKGADTDWQDQVLRTAYTNNHNISFGGGDKNGDYRFAVGYMDQQGIIKNSGMQRTNFRFNGTRKFIDDKLKISTQVTMGQTHDDHVPVTDNSGFEGDLIGNMIKATPTYPVYNPDGTYFQTGVTQPNPVAMINLSKGYTNTLRLLANVSAEYQISKSLSFKTVVGVDRSLSARRQAFSRDLYATGIGGPNASDKLGRLFINDVEQFNKLWENYFNFDKSFGSSKLNAVLGYASQSFNNATRRFQMTNFQTSDLNIMLNNFASANQAPNGGNGGAVGTNSSNTTDALQSFFGRVTYSINDKYIVTATVRADGSTRFGSTNKYGTFPSFAFKWRLKEEGFVPDAFSDLNFRLGYGVTGNQALPHNLYDERLRYNDWGLGNTGNITGGGLGSVSFKNPDLKWESTAQFNAGLDFGLFNNRLRGSVDVYYKDTKDLLYQEVSAQPAPNPFVWKNLNADVINKGVELQLEYDIINNSSFKWTFLGNVAYNYNELTNFNSFINVGTINGQGLTGAFAERLAAGQPLFAFYLRDFAGYDANGISVYNGGDVQKFVGKSPLPKIITGITNNFKYKNWDLNIFFNGNFGQYLYSNTANAFFTAGTLASGRNVTRDVVNSGESNLNAPDVSTRFLYNASFLRLQNVTLGYNLKTKPNWLQALRVYVTGQNLFVITSYPGQDPEVNTSKPLGSLSAAGTNTGIPTVGIDYTSYPKTRTFTVGINATF